MESTLINLYLENYNDFGPVTPDDKDKKIAEDRLNAYDRCQIPRVGDYVITPEGKYQRIAYNWPDQSQTCDYGTFYLGNGYASMSGSLDPGYPIDSLKLTDEKRPGDFWFFHHDFHYAHNGVGVKAFCRVYKVVIP